MAVEQDTYLAVLKASYDYDPAADAEDEIAIKENQLLFLLERTDEECDRPPSGCFHYDLTIHTAGGESRLNRKKKDRLAWCPPPTLSWCVAPHHITGAPGSPQVTGRAHRGSQGTLRL